MDEAGHVRSWALRGEGEEAKERIGLVLLATGVPAVICRQTYHVVSTVVKLIVCNIATPFCNFNVKST